MEPGIRDTCEWARLIPEDRAGAPGKGAQAGGASSSVSPAAWLADSTLPPSYCLFSSDAGCPWSLGARGKLRVGLVS